MFELYSLKSIMELQLDTSFDVNGVIVPANSLSKFLSEFSQPGLFYSSGFQDFNMSKSGSVTKVKFQSRYFALTTHHQITSGQYDFDQLCIHNDTTKMLISSHRVVFQEAHEKTINDFDCLVFEFTDSVVGGSLPSTGWYEISAEIFENRLKKPDRVLTIGYPDHRNFIDYDNGEYPRLRTH